MLTGYKTYLVALAAVLAWGAAYLGWITQDSLDQILKFLGPLGLITLRAGVTKSGPDG